jgi:hypothetical protein
MMAVRPEGFQTDGSASWLFTPGRKATPYAPPRRCGLLWGGAFQGSSGQACLG